MFVCTGNTCRSPMAERILHSMIKKQKIKWWDAISRGISAEVGSEISENSRLALAEIGLECDKFKPKQLTQKSISDSILVVCMTANQKQMLEDCGNVVCVRDLCGFDVPDPYGYGIEQYRKTRDALIIACKSVIKFIKNYKESEE